MTPASIRRFSLIAAAILAGSALAVRAEEAPYPSWGKELYRAHCASCHGEDARGSGPAAVALKTGPTDLTVIAMANGGKFPHAKIADFIRGDFPPGAHGSREMPVWGRVFQPRGDRYGAVVRAEIQALTDYLESIQQKK